MTNTDISSADCAVICRTSSKTAKTGARRIGATGKAINTGCRSTRTKAALYRAPDSTKLLRLWKQAIGRLDGKSECRDVVWNRLVAKIEPHLLAQARRLVPTLLTDPMEAQEIVQEVYLRLLNHDGRVMRCCTAVSDLQLRAYLSVVCETCFTDLVRSRLALKRGSDVTVRFSEQSEERVTDTRYDVEAQVLSRSRLENFRSAIRLCADSSQRRARRNQWIFEEAYVRGRKSGEIARRIGLCPSSVDSVISRMRDDLRGQGWNLAPRYC